MSELLKKYESLDQSKLNEGTIKILNRVKTITADFTADDAKNNKIAEDVLNEVMKKNPDAVKIVKRTPKAKTAPKKTHKATHTTKGTHTTSSTAKTSNNIMSVTKEIQKAGESWKDAMERAKAVIKERKEKVVQKQKTELEKLYNLVKTKKELQGFANSDIRRDSKRDAKPRGARVVTKEGTTSNKYGTFPNKLGRKYWETRDRHADRLAPNYPKNMPLLADGGMMNNMSVHNSTDFFNTPVYAQGGDIDEDYDDVFVKIYNKYNDKNYFGLKEQTSNKLRNWQNALDKGDKNAEKYTKEDVIRFVQDNFMSDSYNGTYLPLKNAIKNSDKKYLKSRVRYDQKFTKELYEAITGNKLPNTNKEIEVYFDSNYADGGYTQGYDDREDERLAMKYGKIANKDLDSTHSRRDDARFEERGKMANGGDIKKLETSLLNAEKKYRKAILSEQVGIISPEELKREKTKLEDLRAKVNEWYATKPIGKKMADGGSVTQTMIVNMPDGSDIKVETKFGILSKISKRVSLEESKNSVLFYNLPTDLQQKINKRLNPDALANGGTMWTKEKVENEIAHYKNLLRNIDKYPDYNKKNVEKIIAEYEEKLAKNEFANGGGIDGGMNNLTIQNVSFAKGGKVKHTFKVGEIVSFPTQKNRYMDKPLLDMINHFSNKELVIEKINEDKPYNLADVYIKDTGEKLRDLILNPKVLKIYPDNVEDEKNVKIKDWYMKTYPTDDLGEELNDDVTFEDMWNEDYQKYDIYQVMGVGDSVIRERLFERLAEIKGVTYSDVYRKLFSSDGFYADGGGVGQKKYNTQFNVGKAKYVVNYHDGVKKHKDGSNFYDIAIFKNKKDFEAFLTKLSKEGYREMGYNSSFEKGGIFYKEGSNKYGLGNTEIFVQEENDMYCVYDNVYNDKSENWEIKKLAEFDTMDEAKEFAIEHSKKEYANGGSLPFMTDPNFGNFQNTGAFAHGGETDGYTLNHNVEFTTSDDDSYLRGNIGGDMMDLIEVENIGDNTYSAIAKSYSVAFEGLKGQELEDEVYNQINEMFATNDDIDVDLESVKIVGEKFELGGAFMTTDLAGHSGGGTGGLNANMPLSGVSGTYYTGLVGETGAMSSGELFMNGGAMAQNQQVINDASQSYVNYYLGEGAGQGIYKDGGSIPNNYAGRTPEDVWDNWSSEQKIHFMQDHKYNIFGDRQISAKDREKFIITKFQDLSRDLRIIVEDHVQEGQYAYGGKTKSRPSMRELYIENIAYLTNTREVGVDGFAKEHNLTDSELSNLMTGLGRKMISQSDFITALVGNKNNPKQKEVVAFAKSDKAYKMADGGSVGDVSGNYYSSTDFVSQNDLIDLAKSTFGQDWESGGDYDYDTEEIKMLVKKLGGGYKIVYVDSEQREKFENAKSKYLPLLKNKSNDGDIFVIPNKKMADGGFTPDVSDGTQFMSGVYAKGGGIEKLRDEVQDLEEEIKYVMSDNSFSKSEKDKYISELKNDIAHKKERIKTYYQDNEEYENGGFTPDVSDGTQFMSGVYAKGGGIRSKEELKKIFSEKEAIVKNLTPKQIAEMWNKNSFGVKEGISKPITIEEAKKPSMKMYLENLLIENELTEEEQAKYFADGGVSSSFNDSVADKMENITTMKSFASKVRNMKTPITYKELNDLLPDYVSGKDINDVLKKNSYADGGVINGGLNKKILTLAEKKGFTIEKAGKELYNKSMTQALVESLTDANYHDEAKEVVVKAEGKTKWSDELYESEYFNPTLPIINDFAREVARKCEWDGDDILNAYYFITKMQGSKVAGMIDDLFFSKNPRTKVLVGNSKKPSKYIDHDDINFVVLKIKGKTVTISGSDVLNGANLLEDGGDLSKTAFYVPRRDVVEVILKNGETIKPVNGYWVLKNYEPITRASSTTKPKAPAKGKVTSPNYPDVNFNHKVVINGKTVNLALSKSYVTGLNGSRQYDFIDVDGNPMTGYGFSVKEALKQVEDYGNNPIYYTKNTPPKIDETKAHFQADALGNVFVDSNFVNQSQNNLPNSELKHYGYGDFYLQTPDGNIDFIRTSEEKEGFVGRTHKMKGSDELVLKLVNAMKEKGRFESTQTFADGGEMENEEWGIEDEIDSMKEMMSSLFTYGGIERGSYGFDRYLSKYETILGKKLFDKIYNEELERLNEYEVEQNVYTDSDGLTYNSLKRKFADGGSTGSGFDPVKVKVVLAIGIDRAIEFYDAEYPIRPYQLLEKAVRKGFITLDEINERVIDSAMEIAQDSEDMEEVGSSDETYAMQEFLNEAGFKTVFVQGRLLREYADGGFMNDVYADGGGVDDEMLKLAKSIVRGTDYKIGLYLPYRTDFYLKDKKGRFGIGSYLVLQDEDNKNEWSVAERKYEKSKGGYYEDIKSGITQKQAYELVKELINSKYADGGEIKDIQKMKKTLIAKAKSRGLYENFGQKEVRVLEDKYGYTNNVRDFDNWAMNFDLSQMADGGFMNDVYAKGGELKGKFLAEIKVPYNYESVVKDEFEFTEFLSKKLTNNWFGNGYWGVTIVKPLFEKDYSQKIVVEIQIPVGVTQGGGLDKFDVEEFISKTLTKKWFGNGYWGVDIVSSYAKGGMFDDNDGFMKADNNNNYRYPEMEVYVETIDEPIDLTNNVSRRTNEVVIKPLDENIDLNDDNRVRARIGYEPKNRTPEKIMMVNPRMVIKDLPTPMSNTHKND